MTERESCFQHVTEKTNMLKQPDIVMSKIEAGQLTIYLVIYLNGYGW